MTERTTNLEATVVEEGAAFTVPGRDGTRLKHFRTGKTVHVFDKARDGRWARITYRRSSGAVLHGFIKSNKLEVNGTRLDRVWGYTGFEPTAEPQLVENDETEDEVEDEVEETVSPIVGILGAGQVGISEVTQERGPRGYLEPGSGTLQFVDRWLTSRERRLAISAVGAKDHTGISRARYAFAGTLVRCGAAVAGLALAASALPALF